MLWESQLTNQQTDDLLSNVPLPFYEQRVTLVDFSGNIVSDKITQLRSVTEKLTDTPLGLGALVSERFRLEEIIGRGGMTIVYIALDTANHDKEVALKLFAPRFQQKTPEGVEAFLYGGRMNSLLTTDRFPEFLGSGEYFGCEYIVNEYLKGANLEHILYNYRDGLSIETAYDIAIQCCYALQDISCHGLVHRDIKPSNIMLTDKGKIKILDFDLICPSSDFGVYESEEFRTTGTVGYMSPEQCSGGDVTARSDIYSLGATLYELLTKRAPFRYSKRSDVKRAHIAETPLHPKFIRADIPDAFSEIILKALAKDPYDRYQSASQMRRALECAKAQL